MNAKPWVTIGALSLLASTVGCANNPANTAGNDAGFAVNGIGVNRLTNATGFTQNSRAPNDRNSGNSMAGQCVQIDSANRTVNINYGYIALANAGHVARNSTQPQSADLRNFGMNITIPIGWTVNITNPGQM